MGQYYLAANMDKKEVLCVNGRFPGMKLLEIAINEENSLAILNQAAIHWKGDYADLSDDKQPYFNALRMWTDKLHVVKSMYHFICDNFKRAEGDTSDNSSITPYPAAVRRVLYKHIQ